MAGFVNAMCLTVFSSLSAAGGISLRNNLGVIASFYFFEVSFYKNYMISK